MGICAAFQDINSDEITQYLVIGAFIVVTIGDGNPIVNLFFKCQNGFCIPKYTKTQCRRKMPPGSVGIYYCLLRATSQR